MEENPWHVFLGVLMLIIIIVVAILAVIGIAYLCYFILIDIFGLTCLGGMIYG